MKYRKIFYPWEQVLDFGVISSLASVVLSKMVYKVGKVLKEIYSLSSQCLTV